MLIRIYNEVLWTFRIMMWAVGPTIDDTNKYWESLWESRMMRGRWTREKQHRHQAARSAARGSRSREDAGAPGAEPQCPAIGSSTHSHSQPKRPPRAHKYLPSDTTLRPIIAFVSPIAPLSHALLIGSKPSSRDVLW